MITNEGRLHIKRYLAGYVPAIARSVSMGIGSRAESVSDIALQMETAKSAVNLTTYDFAANKLLFKATVPDIYIGKIYEIGIYSLEADPSSSEFSSRMLFSFDSATEDWINTTTGAPSTYTNANTRLGVDSLSIAPAASGTQTHSMQNLALDLSGYSSADTINFAYNVGTAFTQSLRIRMMTDGSNFYDFNLGAQTAGYKFVEVSKASATATGSPNWTNITEIQITAVSSASGASNIEFEAIRVEDKDAVALDYILVARKVLATPVAKYEGTPQEIEFSLDVSI